MTEKMLLAVISGLVFPMLLEVWRERRKRKAAAAATSTSQPASGKIARLFRITARLVLSAAFGFFFAAGAAAFLESRGHPHIEFGSDLCIIFIALFSVISWVFLSSIGPLRSRIP
jgi:hypothetical protein